jgi:hypothetical protein
LAYGFRYSNTGETVASGAAVHFPLQGPASHGISYDSNTGSFTLDDTGTYKLTFSVAPGSNALIALEEDGAVVPGSVIVGASGSQLTQAEVILRASAGATLAVENVGASAARFDSDFTNTAIDASIVIERIA